MNISHIYHKNDHITQIITYIYMHASIIRILKEFTRLLTEPSQGTHNFFTLSYHSQEKYPHKTDIILTKLYGASPTATR